jgi:hypothetical protein
VQSQKPSFLIHLSDTLQKTPVERKLLSQNCVSLSSYSYLTYELSFEIINLRYGTAGTKEKLLKAKIAVALHDELGRVPKKEEIEQVFLMARVMYKAILGLHFQRQQQKKNGQLAIF